MARRFGFAVFSPLVGAAVDVWSVSAALAVSAAWAFVGVVLAVALPLRARRRTAVSVRLAARAPEVRDVTRGPRLGEV
jgi:hypothetical protein